MFNFVSAMVPNQNNQAVQPMNNAMNVQSPQTVVPFHSTAGGLQDQMDGSGNARQTVMDVSNSKNRFPKYNKCSFPHLTFIFFHSR